MNKFAHALRSAFTLFILLISGLVRTAQAADSPKRWAQEALRTAGGAGALTVHLGCGDGRKTMHLLVKPNQRVHALDVDRKKVHAARSYLRSQQLYGRISVDSFDGKNLPYANDLVNLVVTENLGTVSITEVMRVLAPGGKLCLRKAGQWKALTKLRPAQIDDWTHYLHSSNGNPVANDDAVRPPKQLQWVSSPRWARHHEHMASMSAMVSADGRVFTICDEGPLVSILCSPVWKLSARNAFNGLLLWKRPIAKWFSHLYPLKSGPASLPRRLVADGDRVYVTLGINAPVSIIEAKTGSTMIDCKGTEGTQEIVLSKDRLFLIRGQKQATNITAADPRSGKILWDVKQSATALTLAADRRMVVFFNGEKVVALDRESGSTRWMSKRLPEKNKANWISKNPPRLILDDRAVIIALQKKVYAVSPVNGKMTWSAVHPRSGYVSPEDLFVIDGLVWYGETAGAASSGKFIGRDIATGEIKKSFLPDIDIIWLSHHRCHFSKATKNFILPSRMGVEFVDIKDGAWKQHHWVRGGCMYGIMPCNGLLYTPPHACACYFEMKQNGFSAYTSNSDCGTPAAAERLEKGPAYGHAIQVKISGAQPGSDWPVFRHDSSRSGHTPTRVAAELKSLWTTRIGGKLTQPVVSSGKLYVAAVDQHTLYALQSETGKTSWTFTAGARIDSPPSIHGGRAYFGSRDGWIYCIRCSDGTLVWRYRAAPGRRLIMSYGQLESAWPVHGSVLILNNEIHCVTGRNMFLDGGLRYLRLDSKTGKVISKTVMDDRDPMRGGSIQKYDSWLDMTTTLPDVLAYDGKNVYMRSQPFDTKGKRRRISHFPEEHEPAHVFSPTGFLDGTWFHRSYWTYARCFPGGWNGHLAAGRYNPSGRLLVRDDTTVYGFGRKPKYYRWTSSLEYRLFATESSHAPKDIYAWDKYKAKQAGRFPRMKLDRKLSPPYGPKALPGKTFKCKWENNRVPLLVRAMVSTRDSLFIAGPADIMDEKDLYFKNAATGIKQMREELQKQSLTWTGKNGAILQVVSKERGKTLAQHRLPTLPTFDGMIAANGKLFISLQNGSIVSMGSDAMP